MRTIYCTLGHGHPNFPGYIKVTGATWGACREAVWKFTDGYFAFDYSTLNELHISDKVCKAELEAVGDPYLDKGKSILPKLINAEAYSGLENFRGFKYAI